MRAGEHGDRTTKPKPMHELIAEHRMQIQQERAEREPTPDPVAQGYGGEDPYAPRAEWPIEQGQTPPPTIDESVAANVRAQAVAIAAQSFGIDGMANDDILFERANSIFNYILNGKP